MNARTALVRRQTLVHDLPTAPAVVAVAAPKSACPHDELLAQPALPAASPARHDDCLTGRPWRPRTMQDWLT